MTRIARIFWDRLLASGLVIGGVVVLILGWYGASGTPYAEEQIPYIISAGFSALALIGLGATAWLSSDIRDEWYRLRELEQVVASLTEQLSAQSSSIEDDGQEIDPDLRNGRFRRVPAGVRR